MRLEAQGVTSGYGPVPIIHDVSLEIPENAIVAILGPNGAGKSTLLKTLARHLPVMSGSLLLDGERYDDMDATRAARAGIALVSQTGNVFGELSVEDNLRLGALRHPDGKKAIAEVKERFAVLGERSRQSAGSLSGGERQLLAVSCALLMRPGILLLDEPTTGLSPLAAQATAELIEETVQEGRGVAWVVEQMPELALERARHAYFVEAGQVTFYSDAAALLEEGRLQELMLQHAQ
jgi:branched-chain amino acid transport system ATP-binding protein